MRRANILILAIVSGFIGWFQVPSAQADDGPGGPILVISSATNPFGRYYGEILRCEGLNEFLVVDVTAVTPSLLNGYDVAILSEMSLSAGQVTTLTNWVNAGGNLIAMRPDPQLAPLLGITSLNSTLPSSRPYLLVNTAVPPGLGIVNQTIQFHGNADLYSLSGATLAATLYTDAVTPASSPAVTLVSVGGSGGQAAAFAYDLARSVVLTRQGNPAWSGQERDGIAPIRSDDLFYGNASGDPQPDWVNLNKVAIPQADEQQRLLANLILHMNFDRKPLPRLWYLPKGLKAAVVMTGDEHGCCPGSRGQFGVFSSVSAPGCSVDDWECVRSTSYVYNGGDMADAEALSWTSAGFELGVHVTSFCANWTPASLASNYSTQLGAFAAQFPSLPAPATNRTHCIAWSDFDTQPQVALANGIRLDTNYYYWPPAWVLNRPGMFTGSGMPMRFAKADGTLIDCYQVATQMTDESDQTFPATCDTLLDRATGAQGFYGAFCANMHTDQSNHPGANAIVASAQARGIPVISARQLLTWLDGRNNSSFGSLVWSGNQLSFTVTAATGSRNLRGMVPAISAIGPLTGITRGASPIAYNTETIKGVAYAFFAAPTGSYVATYQVDTTPPVITNIASSTTSNSSVINWNTNEAADSRVDYGTSPTSLDQNATDSGLVSSHTIYLSGLLPNSVYFYRVSSRDASNNSATSPATLDDPLIFVTPAPDCILDTLAADFSAGSPDANLRVFEVQGGEVSLAPAEGTDFSGVSLPGGWTCSAWSGGGGCNVAGGLVTVNGARTGTSALFGPNRTLEFVATFQGDSFQHVGFVKDFDFSSPWAIFSTFGGGALYARTSNGTNTLIPGSWLGAPHRYRIDWKPTGFDFAIDAVQVATIPFVVTDTMRPLASELSPGGGAITLDWLRLTPYTTPGLYLSRVFDAGQTRQWDAVLFTADVPAGTSLSLDVRLGQSPSPDATWTPFLPISNSGDLIGGSSRYLQYRAALSTSDASRTPLLKDVSITCLPGSDSSPPAISGVLATPAADGLSAEITWTTNEPADSRVDYGTNPAALTDVASTNTFTFSHSLVLPVLSPATTYYYRVTSADTDTNSVTFTAPPGFPLFFMTPVVFQSQCPVDTSFVDFSAGTPDSGVLLSQVDDGELTLLPALSAQFAGGALPAEMAGFLWSSPAGFFNVGGGLLTVDGARVNTEPASGFGPGRSLEFVATFAASPFQHIGFGGGNDSAPGEIFNTFPWAMFSTGSDGASLKARTWSGGPFNDFVIPGSWLGAAHRYRIAWNAGGCDFYIDGSLVRSDPTAISGPMRPAISDLAAGGGVVIVDSMTMTPYAASGSFASRVFDAGFSATWGGLNWLADTPPSTSVSLFARTGNSANPDGSWTSFAAIAAPGDVVGQTGRYLQYRSDLATGDGSRTPVLRRVSIQGALPYTVPEIAEFVSVLLGIDVNPNHYRRADANCDNVVNGQDIQPFVNAAL